MSKEPPQSQAKTPQTRPGMKRRVRECSKCPLNGRPTNYCWQVCLGPAEISEKGQSIRRLGSFESPDEFLGANILDDIASRFDKDTDPARNIDLYDDFEINGGVRSDDDVYQKDPTEADSITTYLRRDDSPSVKIGQENTRNISDEVQVLLVPILANLMSLSDTQLCILRHIYNGDDLAKTGASLPRPMSKQAVSKHVKAICEGNAVIAKVIRAMMRTGHGGAHATRRAECQLELF